MTRTHYRPARNFSRPHVFSRTAMRSILRRSFVRTLLCGGFAFGLAATASATNLVGVYRDALAHDPIFRQAHALYMAAREARPEAFAALLPQLTGTAGRTWDHSAGSQGSTSSTSTGSPYVFHLPYSENSNGKQWSLNLSAPLFSWADWMNLKAADSQVAQAQASYQQAAQNLILRTATAYFNVLAAVDTLQAQESSLKAYTLQLQQALERFKVGLIAITDVEQARAARDTAVANVIIAKQALANAQDQLEVITGRQYSTLAEPGSDMPLVMPNPASQSRWVGTALKQNLTLIASRLGASAAEYNVRAVFGADLPTISLVASRSYSNDNNNETVFGQVFHGLGSDINDRQVGIELSMPIFSGGGDLARIHQAQYQSIAANDAVDEASRTTVQQTRDAYLGVITGIANVRALRQALKSSETAYAATSAGYKVGTQTEVDVLNALSVLVQARTNYATSRYSYINSVIQLQYAAGILGPDEVQVIDRWLTKRVPVSPGEITPSAMTPPPAPQSH
jgi:outer membrane protein